MTNNDSSKCNGYICRLWNALTTPSTKYSLGFLIVFIFIVSSFFWIGFNYSLEVTNTEEFCVSCHEMNEFVFEEYKETSHYRNRTGVRATCPDCHVPKEWSHKLVRKMHSINELFHKALGTINTREKYEARRMELAERVWATMEKNNSRECRNCHDYKFMDYTKQGEEGAETHPEGLDGDMTCIDCHKGIAHKLPEPTDK